ncbi:hypothetical protein BGX38DRAFT_1231963 [Terfezia claveryi]|nr:hypothetical protein BGX38DRAFT_1231963 [Terfezia claveryi]
MDYAYEEHEHEEEDDDLGYYPDGVKRTLTDAQIAIFRHSEIQEMLSTSSPPILSPIPYALTNPHPCRS